LRHRHQSPAGLAETLPDLLSLVASVSAHRGREGIARGGEVVMDNPFELLWDVLGHDENKARRFQWIDVPDEGVYAACRTNGRRATKLQMQARYEAIERIVAKVQPCSVRQVYYQAVVHGVVDKTDAGYDKVQRALVDLRRSDAIPYRCITDNSRWQIKPTSYNSITDALEQTARLYRRAVWNDVDAYCEVWLEKDALAGVVHPITDKYDVSLMVSRGFSSLSFLHNAAEHILEVGKPAYIYHLGDHDPSGVCAAEKIEETLQDFAWDAEIHFERLAVLPEQIAEWDLPTRPTKRSDSRAKNFRGESVELDAVHPDALREIVLEAIEQHLPKHQLEVLAVAEESEREQIKIFAQESLA
jgi:hypothetical protein